MIVKDTNLDNMLETMRSLRAAKQHTDPKFHDVANNFVDYLIDSNNVELAMKYVRWALITHNLPIDPHQINRFDELHIKYGAAILGLTKPTKVDNSLTFSGVYAMVIVAFWIIVWILF
jgi:hypothetical protein